MFCPSCGSEERQASQYCRACGTDLRPVRVSLERPDSITASAVTAREEIGRAVAQQIRQVEDTNDLKKVAEDVLPQIEKFLESPDEKRLRLERRVASDGEEVLRPRERRRVAEAANADAIGIDAHLGVDVHETVRPAG